ncbi:hypothetical protein QT986_09795, partial [Microcoleus sp. herbarium14]
LNGQLEAREREISTLHSQAQSLQTAVGEKQVLESQLSEVRSQLKESSATITRLQTQQKSTGSLEVDVDLTSIMLENETLHSDLNESLTKIEGLKARLAEFESQSQPQLPTELPTELPTDKRKKQKVSVTSSK